MERKRAAPSGFLGSLSFLVLLLVPATWRALERRGERPDARRSLDAASAAVERDHLLESNRRLQRELRALSGIEFDLRSLESVRSRYRAFAVDVLSFVDPSPGRRALFVLLDPEYRVPSDCATTYEGALVGRLERLPWTASVARVQSVLDPGLRVKFRSGESRGVLHGTGRRERGGGRRPLLEVRHLVPITDLPADAPVFTAGGDGIYPPGILIGWVGEAESGAYPLVRAAVSPEEMEVVAVLVDMARAEWERVLEAGAR